MYLEYKDAFELKKACFEWFEGGNVHLNSRGPDLSGLRVQKAYLRARGFS